MFMKTTELWFFIFLLGVLLFNWPFLDIFSLSLQYYLFGIWALFILFIGFFVSRSTKEKPGRDV
jgi:hypothetical protein